jgi:transcriptional activator of cad operon
MEPPTPGMLRIGEWCVDPASGQISRYGENARLEVRSMKLLLCLAEHPSEVVSIDDLLSRVWTGVNVSPDSVYQAVTSLRRILGDDPKQPRYIATVPRLGYRMVAPVSPWSEATVGDGAKSRGEVFPASVLKWAGGAAICVVIILGFLVRGKFTRNHQSAASAPAAPQQRSIAVLPFLDLTEHMAEEEFADGMTEELIDKLSRIPGLRVPAPTASFYFKNKHVPIAEIAKSLAVAYVLDGSVRKSGGRVRIAARLVHADNGYVIWSETYDRPFDDALMIQDDIAGEVTKALQTSIDGKPDHD